MGLRERIYIIEVLRGLRITGAVFFGNMWKWVTFRKGALTTYYPEERRSDYSPNNRGRHVLTQRANGEVQCVSCNLCATACPAYCIEILSHANFADPAHPKAPERFEIDYSALHLLWILRRGLPRGCDPHGQGHPRSPGLRSHGHVGKDGPPVALASDHESAQALSAGATACGSAMISDVLIAVFGAMAIVFALLVVVLRQPMRAALALIAHMASLAAIFACLDVHVVALFQILIYVGAVMVFMVYAIMLLDDRDASLAHMFSRWSVPAVIVAAVPVVALGAMLVQWAPLSRPPRPPRGPALFRSRPSPSSS